MATDGNRSWLKRSLVTSREQRLRGAIRRAGLAAAVAIKAQRAAAMGAGFTGAAGQWAQATEQRAVAVATACAARAELERARSQRLADFEAGTRGLRSGWLARLSGLEGVGMRKCLQISDWTF